MRFISSWRSKAASFFPSARARCGNGFTEHVIRTGEPLLIESDLEQVRSKLGIGFRASAAGAVVLRSAYFSRRQTGGRDGGDEYGPGIAVHTQGISR